MLSVPSGRILGPDPFMGCMIWMSFISYFKSFLCGNALLISCRAVVTGVHGMQAVPSLASGGPPALAAGLAPSAAGLADPAAGTAGQPGRPRACHLPNR